MFVEPIFDNTEIGKSIAFFAQTKYNRLAGDQVRR
jgi:hypothetical protein